MNFVVLVNGLPSNSGLSRAWRVIARCEDEEAATYVAKSISERFGGPMVIIADLTEKKS